jgi:hypothetical protein
MLQVTRVTNKMIVTYYTYRYKASYQGKLRVIVYSGKRIIHIPYMIIYSLGYPSQVLSILISIMAIYTRMAKNDLEGSKTL